MKKKVVKPTDLFINPSKVKRNGAFKPASKLAAARCSGSCMSGQCKVVTS